MKRRPGFTLVELLVVLAMLGILATIAMPYYWDARHRALAARIVSDYNNVRVSALSYHASTNELPATQGWGVIPPEMRTMLPDSFAFSQPNYEYRWQIWSGASLGGEFATSELVAGLAVRSSDARLVEAIRNTYQGRYIGAAPGEVTLLIQ